MRKIQLRLFDVRRNQNFWFHFCYIPEELWIKYQEKYQVNNMDAQVKAWVKQDFDFEIVHMKDLYEVKNLIQELYAKKYPDIALTSESDRQGWTRVWLVNKLKELLEETNE